MLGLWSMWRSGMGGVGHLPDAGGSLDQAAIMIDAFRAMDAAYDVLEEQKKARQPRGRR